jgi:hypothetical protein
MLAMAAVLLRCVIAPGLMLDPMAAARGELKLVICTSAGAKSIAPTPDQGPAPHQQSDGELCSYAALGHAGSPADPLALGGERLQPTFEAPVRDTADRSVRMRGFGARAPPKLT